MLENILNSLSILLSSPYDKLNLPTKDKIHLNNSILEKIYFKKLIDFKRRKKLNSSFKNFDFNYSYNILEENSNFIKVKLNLIISFITEDFLKDIPSACIREFILIFENCNNKLKLQFLLENEEDPFLYNYILSSDLSSDTISNILSKKYCFEERRTSSIESFPINFITSAYLPQSNSFHRLDNNFNVDEACSYAETFALKPNPKYKYFEGIGGDCTNFISQILYAGGFKQTPTWKPYTNAWIRVEEIYSYLTSRNLGTKLPNDTSLDRGCLIQFYTPSKGRFFHNGFITYKLQNNDCLYCCHSYNKLNYPLSEIYPNKYPTLRALRFI